MQITMTDRAASRVLELMADRGGELYLRLLVQRRDQALTYHFVLERAPRPDDAVVVTADVRLLVDPASGELLDGCSIDFLPGPAGFAVYNPNLATGGVRGSGVSWHRN